MENLNIDQENKEGMFVLYTAEFVNDIDGLLKEFPPKRQRVFGHHSTIAFRPANLDGIVIGKQRMMKIVGRTYNEKGDALLVENPKSNNKYPHITLSCAQEISPVYSNELLEQAITNDSLERFATPIEIQVVEGYSDGKKNIIST